MTDLHHEADSDSSKSHIKSNEVEQFLIRIKDFDIDDDAIILAVDQKAFGAFNEFKGYNEKI